jgi:hypothetical protein
VAALSYPPNVIREVVSQLNVGEELVALCDFRLPRHDASRAMAAGSKCASSASTARDPVAGGIVRNAITL